MNEGAGVDARRHPRAARRRPSRRWSRATSSSCALTGARYHVAHVSSAESVRLVREAKRRGLPVTCEVTPHHLTLTDEACAHYDTHAKCNPPLRTAADVEALREALADGTIDAIATDHAPHSPVEKDVEFEQAAFGMIGLETARAAGARAGARRGADAGGAGDAAVGARRRRCFGLPGGTLADGAPRRRHRDRPRGGLDLSTPAALRSRSRNTPFRGPRVARAGRADHRRRYRSSTRGETT